MKIYPKLIFRLHALVRMAQRGFEPGDIHAKVAAAELLEDYPSDLPYPSFLLLLWINKRPVHVVAANNDQDKETIIITVYEPDQSKWTDGFRRRIS